MITDVTATVLHPRLQHLPWWPSVGALLERARDGIAILDASLRVAVWNRAASLMTGASAADTVGYGCDIAGNLLTVDLSRRPSEPANGAAARVGVDVQLYDLRIKTRGGGFTAPHVVATLVPVHGDNVHAFVHLSPAVVTPSPIVSAADGLPVALTEREYEILALLASGKTAKPIASELSVSLPTVRTHIRHILRKLGVHSCLEAVVWFLRARQGAAGDMGPGLHVADARRLAAEASGYWVDDVVGAPTPPSSNPTFV
jgi:DNA-binding CsgD family transcriptional regulator